MPGPSADLSAGGRYRRQGKLAVERKLNLNLRLTRGISGGSTPSPGTRAGVAQWQRQPLKLKLSL
jgi:hypothetical protein